MGKKSSWCKNKSVIHARTILRAFFLFPVHLFHLVRMVRPVRFRFTVPLHRSPRQRTSSLIPLHQGRAYARELQPPYRAPIYISIFISIFYEKGMVRLVQIRKSRGGHWFHPRRIPGAENQKIKMKCYQTALARLAHWCRFKKSKENVVKPVWRVWCIRRTAPPRQNSHPSSLVHIYHPSLPPKFTTQVTPNKKQVTPA